MLWLCVFCLCRYFCNAKLGLTQWHHPAQQAPARAAAAAPAPAAPQAAVGAFIAAAAFTGARPGYVFKSGDKGLGYYQDSTGAGLAPASAAAAAAGAGPVVSAAPTAAAGAVAGPAVHRPHAAAAAAGGGDEGDEGARGPKKTRQELIAERQAARNAALAKSGRGRAKMGGGDDDIDPMDPVSTGCALWAWSSLSIGADCLAVCSNSFGRYTDSLPAAMCHPAPRCSL